MIKCKIDRNINLHSRCIDCSFKTPETVDEEKMC